MKKFIKFGFYCTTRTPLVIVAAKCSSRWAENLSFVLNNATEFVVGTPQKKKINNSHKHFSNQMTVDELLDFASTFIAAAPPCTRLMPGKLVNSKYLRGAVGISYYLNMLCTMDVFRIPPTCKEVLSNSDFTTCRMVVSHRRFGTISWSHL